MDTVTLVQSLDEAVCIIYSANILRKVMEPLIQPTSVDG